MYENSSTSWCPSSTPISWDQEFECTSLFVPYPEKKVFGCLKFLGQVGYGLCSLRGIRSDGNGTRTVLRKPSCSRRNKSFPYHISFNIFIVGLSFQSLETVLFSYFFPVVIFSNSYQVLSLIIPDFLLSPTRLLFCSFPYDLWIRLYIKK